ncbi:MAG: hypothetical protein WC222_04915 [Parachlamydiales bacterium]|jgi:hypothetical protein
MLKISEPAILHTSVTSPYYQKVAEHLLHTVIPEHLICPHTYDKDIHEDEKDEFEQNLPVFLARVGESPEEFVSFTLLWKNKPHVFRFVFEMLTRWLCPGKRINVTTVFASDVKLPDLSPQVLTICEITLLPTSEHEMQEIRNNLPLIESEIRSGVKSRFIAWRILEVKGLTTDEKTVIIHEQISFMLKRQNKYFDNDLITEMQHMLVMMKDDFLSHRESRYLTRLVCTQYLFRKDLCQKIEEDPQQRYLYLKLLRCRMMDPENPRMVLGIVIGVNFIGQNEYFNEKHLMKAINNYLSHVLPIEGSFISHRRGSEHVCTIYMEIEKEDGSLFTVQEILLLQRELPYDLKDRIEHLMHPVFMPRNEEDIMRNILNLSSQIKFVKDMPQVSISFDEQTRDSLLFTVTVVQVSIPGSPTIQDLLQENTAQISYTHERTKMVGMLRKKYAKFASVFRAKLRKNAFIRGNGSLDLNKARQLLVEKLGGMLGNFRDYNGGMISKQNEQLCALRQYLEGKTRSNDLLLENFFYSLSPVVMRTVLDVRLMGELFSLLNVVLDERLFKTGVPIFKSAETKDSLLLIVSADDVKTKDELMRLISHLNHEGGNIAHSFVQVYNVPYLCFALLSSNGEQRESFLKMVQESLHAETFLQNV